MNDEERRRGGEEKRRSRGAEEQRRRKENVPQNFIPFLSAHQVSMNFYELC